MDVVELGMSTDVRLVQPSKALFPIVVAELKMETELGLETDTRLAQP
jgi:hypothetical protein